MRRKQKTGNAAYLCDGKLEMESNKEVLSIISLDPQRRMVQKIY